MPSKASSAVRNPKFPHSFISPGAVLKGKEAMRERNLPWNSRASAAPRAHPASGVHVAPEAVFLTPRLRLHLGGIVGCDCDHRHSRCVAAPGGANGPRGGAAAAMLQWRQASGDRAAQFPCGQRQLPVRADRKDERLRPSPDDLDSWALQILPYLEQPALYDALTAQLGTGGESWWTPGRWLPIPSLWCPSDPASPKVVTAGWSESPGGTPQLSQGFSGNVVACAGSMVFNPAADPTGEHRDGIFYVGSQTRVDDIRDGASNTLLLGELIVIPDIMLGIQVAGGNSGGQMHDDRGRYWCSHQGAVLFSTLYPPNTPVADRHLYLIDTPPQAPGVIDTANLHLSLRSYHPGGVNVAMADGSGRFVSNFVDAAVFLGLGTCSGGEVIPGDF